MKLWPIGKKGYWKVVKALHKKTLHKVCGIQNIQNECMRTLEGYCS